jgi:hypothetical protein
MKRMAFLLIAAFSAMSFSLAALGQQSQPKVVGKLKDVKGLVTVTTGDMLATAVSGAPLIADTRIVATSSGEVILNFDIGCDIKLEANQSIRVRDGLNCAALLASVESVGGPFVVAAGAGGVGIPGYLLAAGGALIIVGTTNRGNSVSPD